MATDVPRQKMPGKHFLRLHLCKVWPAKLLTASVECAKQGNGGSFPRTVPKLDGFCGHSEPFLEKVM